MFHRSGGGTAPESRDFIMGAFAQLDDQKILDSVDAALNHLRGAGWTTTVVPLVVSTNAELVSGQIRTPRAPSQD
jgi:hypothetical protein